jgi:hypothetical protein
MHLTAQLGECYLWVDSLCIEQDNLVDCKRQIGLMDQIYSNAVITIVAASGNDAEAGLAGLCTAPRKMVQIKEEINGRTLLITQRLLKGQLLESKWFSRGWTYQEGFLSARCLIFTDQDCSFVCWQSQFRESIADIKVRWRDTSQFRSQRHTSALYAALNIPNLPKLVSTFHITLR